MGRTITEAPITTASARAKLAKGEYARRLDPNATLYYRRGVRGGVWFCRWRNTAGGAAYRQAPIGPANDVNDKLTPSVLTFAQAEAEARKIVAAARAEAEAAKAGPIKTVGDVVREYIAMRDARASEHKGRAVSSDAASRLGRYVIGHAARGRRPAIAPAPLAVIPLHALKSADLKAWLAGLPADLKASAIGRTVNDLKAALHSADPSDAVLREIRLGLRARPAPEAEAISLAREDQFLTAPQVVALLKAAREIDAESGWDGDLFRLVLALAATGARFSQVARMRVGDVQRDLGRLLVPTSRKGRPGAGKPLHTPRPVGADVLAELLPATVGRPADAPLFERWRHRQVAGEIYTWERTERGAWQSASELVRPWAAIAERAGMAGVVAYSLRHTSISNALAASLPVRLVAALHDTSVAMIEGHYARFISSELEALAARAIVPLVPQTTANNVIKIAG